MDRNELLAQMKEILRQIDGHNDSVIDACTEETDLRSGLGVNSIAMLYLMVVIQEKYDIDFENAKMEDFKKLGDVIDFIEREA